MDLRAYYQKIREVREGLTEPCVVVSLETADGGKAGVLTTVPRDVAAKMIVGGRARVATAEETERFQDETREATLAAEQLAAASRMQVTVIPSSKWRKSRD